MRLCSCGDSMQRSTIMYPVSVSIRNISDIAILHVRVLFHTLNDHHVRREPLQDWKEQLAVVGEVCLLQQLAILLERPRVIHELIHIRVQRLACREAYVALLMVEMD
jgi:hypothetical protein